ncbi:hypothetical protein Taro_047526, partial [Colocasia esculenta]|nr:hypothetical protein [Colocasia esculenta]
PQTHLAEPTLGGFGSVFSGFGRIHGTAEKSRSFPLDATTSRSHTCYPTLGTQKDPVFRHRRRDPPPSCCHGSSCFLLCVRGTGFRQSTRRFINPDAGPAGPPGQLGREQRFSSSDLLIYPGSRLCLAIVSLTPEISSWVLVGNPLFPSLCKLRRSIVRNRDSFLVMGEEAPVSCLAGFDESLLDQLDSGSDSHQTVTIIGEKIFVIGKTNDGDYLPISVRILDKSMGKVIPNVLGTQPVSLEGHSAMLLDGERILILKQNSSLDDCVWFLEIDTPFVREQKQKLGTEVVAWSKGVEGDSLKPIVISGPSGVGKGTLISKLMNEFPSTFGFSVSHTTRLPREKEKNGVHYHFTQRSVMEKDIRDGKFLEYASVHGNLYGTSYETVEAVADEGKRCILDIDVQGARSVRASPLEAIFTFVCPPSFEELEKRLRSRGTETEEQVQKRLRNAKAELEEGKSSGLFDHILVNDDLEACYMNLKKILGLDESTKPDANGVEVPTCRSISKSDQKIMVQCGTTEVGKGSSGMYMIDASSLKGGAPGRTRGLKINAAANPLSDCLNGI